MHRTEAHTVLDKVNYVYLQNLIAWPRLVAVGLIFTGVVLVGLA